MNFGWLYPLVAFGSFHGPIVDAAFPAPMALAMAWHRSADVEPLSLKQQYDALMKRSFRVKLEIAPKSVTDLVELYRRVTKEKGLKIQKKRKMQNRLAIRMARFHTILVRDFKRGERKRQRALKFSKKSPREIEVPQAGAGSVCANALALIELIQNTIEPESWAANGGLGTIEFYRPLNALVIRNTLHVHRLIGGGKGK